MQFEPLKKKIQLRKTGRNKNIKKDQTHSSSRNTLFRGSIGFPKASSARPNRPEKQVSFFLETKYQIPT